MIQIIAGLQGSGKTKSLIDLANAEVKESKGHIVYVDADQSHLQTLAYKIRLVSACEFPLESAEEFIGFVCGILSQDYDICTVYIDGLLKNAKTDVTALDSLIAKVESVSEKFGVDFKISMCCDPELLTEKVKAYLI